MSKRYFKYNFDNHFLITKILSLIDLHCFKDPAPNLDRIFDILEAITVHLDNEDMESFNSRSIIEPLAEKCLDLQKEVAAMQIRLHSLPRHLYCEFTIYKIICLLEHMRMALHKDITGRYSGDKNFANLTFG
ncbi:MAG: hypothetical protein ACRCSG_02470 [Cellulosilyticaceae bacterium]